MKSTMLGCLRVYMMDTSVLNSFTTDLDSDCSSRHAQCSRFKTMQPGYDTLHGLLDGTALRKQRS